MPTTSLCVFPPGSLFNLTMREIGFCVCVSASFGITWKFFEFGNLFLFWFKAKLNYFLLRWTERKMSPTMFMERPVLWRILSYFRRDEIFRRSLKIWICVRGLCFCLESKLSRKPLEMFKVPLKKCNWSRLYNNNKINLKLRKESFYYANFINFANLTLERGIFIFK